MRDTHIAAMRAGRVMTAVAAIAAIGTLVAAAAVAAAAGPAATRQDTTANLTYNCQYSSGTPAATPVTISASFPVSAQAGQAIQPTGVRVTVRLPATAAAHLAALRAATVAGTMRLTTRVVDQASGATSTTGTSTTGTSTTGTSTTGTSTTGTSTWAGLTVPPTRLPTTPTTTTTTTTPTTTPPPSTTPPATTTPAASGLVLTATGTAPPTRVRKQGQVTITAAGLTLTLTPRRADGSATRPAALPITCTPAPGRSAVLARIAARPGSPTASAPAAARHRSQCPPQPKGGLKLNPHFPIPRPPRGIIIHHPPPALGCAYVTGYSDVRKFNEAARVGVGFVALAINLRVDYNFSKSQYFQADSAGQLDFRPCAKCKIMHGLPPTRATFLAFGFMPTTATLQLTEIGTLNLISVGTVQALQINTSWSEMSLRVYDVRVNGVPLNVGPRCRAARPFRVVLSGFPTSHPPYSLQTGGPLTGNVTIPPFTGCGVSENLDPLFTGSISGPRNFTELTQGNLCTPASGSGCPARRPRPIH